MGDKPITLGSMILTLAEPHAGHAVSYNRWYEDDHLYATLLGPGAIAGARFVARRQEKASRQVTGGDDPSHGSLLAVYWLVGDGGEHAAWRVGNVGRLQGEGRFYLERDLVFAYTGRVAFSLSRPSGAIPVELALDHRFPHLAMTVIRPGGSEPGDGPARLYLDRCAPAITGPGSPVALVAGFVARRASDPRAAGRRAKVAAGADAGGVADELVVLWFCDSDPSAAGWADLLATQRRSVEAGGGGQVVWASPFVGTVVGTDTYMDEL